MRLTNVCLVGVALACAMRAGEANFEVAIVKPSGHESATRRFLIQGRRFATFHTSLADLVQFAYGLHPRQIANGPGWITSAAFSDAGRASSFLRFIVELVLDGRPGEIKESVIAVEVLRRSSSFDSKTDSIVRVEAARLRDRLREYYDHHGTADDVLISVPKGGYVPEFSERQPRAHLQALEALRFSILPPENAVFDSFVISPDARRIALTAYLNGHDALGAGPRLARREAPARDGECRVPILVAGQPFDRFLHAFQVEDHPRCRGTVPRPCGRRPGKRRRMESRWNHPVLPKAGWRSASDSRGRRNAPAGDVAGRIARRDLARLSAVAG